MNTHNFSPPGNLLQDATGATPQAMVSRSQRRRAVRFEDRKEPNGDIWREGFDNQNHLIDVEVIKHQPTSDEPRQSATMTDWPILNDDAKHGIAWDVAKHAGENSEADMVLTLVTFLSYSGACFGPERVLWVGDECHYPRINAVGVGKSGRAGRKGTSAGLVKRIFKHVRGGCPDTPGPLSTGEGLVSLVRNPSERTDADGKPVDPGARDKRLFVLCGEFAGALKAGERAGNTLSVIIRCLFDSGDVAPAIKNNPVHCSGAHVGILTHITPLELESLLSVVDIHNGVVNRFLWIMTRRGRKIPLPASTNQQFIDTIAARIEEAIVKARKDGAIVLTETARKQYVDWYNTLEDGTGVYAVVIGRAEVHVLRIAMIYALLDESDNIDYAHMKAALALWNYCAHSARLIFGERQANSLASDIKIAIAAATDGLTRADLQQRFKNQTNKEALDSSLNDLLAGGEITSEVTGGGPRKGRPRTTYRVAHAAVEAEEQSNRQSGLSE